MGLFKVALLIDGGHLREVAKGAGHQYTPDYIEAFPKKCIDKNEELLRVLYYDAPLYRGDQQRPVTGTNVKFKANDEWLNDLASRNLFAVRRGHLAFRGWKLRSVPTSGKPLSDDDFAPNFEQKGVDMRIGLDIATLSQERRIDRIILVSADADMIPAMKHARKVGVQIVAIQLPGPNAQPLNRRFLAHVDIKRTVELPNANKPSRKPRR